MDELDSNSKSLTRIKDEEEGREVGQGAAVVEFGDFAGVEVEVGQLDGDLFERVGLGVDVGVELGLGPVQRVGDVVPAGLDGLDFFEQDLAGTGEEAVNAALDSQNEVGGLEVKAKANLFLVTRGAGALEPLVAAGAGQGAAGADEVAFAAKVAAAEDELDQLANLNAEDGFQVRGHAPSFTARGRPGNRIIMRDG